MLKLFYSGHYDPLTFAPTIQPQHEGIKVNNPFKRNLLFCVLNAATCMMAEEGLATGAVMPQQETLLDLDSVEGMNFSDIEDAPGFVNPPNGIYILTLDKACIETYKTKEKDGKPSETRKRFAHYYSVTAVNELEDAKEQAPTIGSKFSERFMLNEKGITYWKSKAKDIVGELGQGITVANVLAELNTGNYSFVAKIQNKKTKGQDGKDYTNCNVRVVRKVVEPTLP